MGTNGSVLPLFKKQIEKWNKVTVTDPGMTRFLMSTREAIHLIFEAISLAQGGEIFVMRMPAISVADIVETMIERYGNSTTEIENIGCRPGEKKHEVLVSKSEIPHTYELSDRYFVIVPEIDHSRYADLVRKGKLTKLTEFSSQNAEILSKDQLLAQLEVEDWA